MDKFAVSVLPVTDVGAWREFLEEISVGSRSAAHKDFLRAGGVSTEHVILQPTPMGDLMVLVWEGVDQQGASALLGRVAQDPTTDHERYLRDYVMPKLHGLDPTGPPPPEAERIVSTAT